MNRTQWSELFWLALALFIWVRNLALLFGPSSTLLTFPLAALAAFSFARRQHRLAQTWLRPHARGAR